MFMLTFITFIITMISMIIMKISMILSKKMKLDFEKMSPFECGFDPISSSRMPFSLRFFLITIIFLIFDVEIALMMPMIKTFFMSNLLNWSITSMLFLLILLMGIYHEWNQGALDWTN